MKESPPRLQVVDCFNHRFELSKKDAFKTDTFVEIDKMLMKLYYLYQKSPKRLRELKRISEACEKSVPKSSKSHGTCQIDHKLETMQLVLENYGVFLAHVESLSQTNSKAQKRSELKGYYQRQTDASTPVHMAIYLDVLSQLRLLRLGFQKELHDPVKAVRRIQEFTQAMAKLRLLIDKSYDSPETLLTNFNKLLSNIRERNKDHFYAGINPFITEAVIIKFAPQINGLVSI